MRRGGRLFILLGVGLAIIAGLLAIMALTAEDEPEEASNVDPTVSIVRSARDISANAVIEESDVETVEVKQSSVSPGAATNPSQVVGLAVNGDLVKGQQILMGNLVTPGLTNIVSEGKRAVAIPVDRLSAIGGLIRSDDHVDIVYSTRLNLMRVLDANVAEIREDSDYAFDNDTLVVPPPDAPVPDNYPYPGEAGSRFIVGDTTDGNPVTKVVLQDIHVLRVIAGDITVEETPTPTDESIEENERDTISNRLPGADLLVVEVDPQQAEVIRFLLDNEGLFQVLLRGANDHSQATTTGVTYDQLVTNLGLPVPKTVTLPEGE